LAKQSKTYTFSTFCMRKSRFVCFLICLGFVSRGQITLIGHTMINKMPLTEVAIFIKEGSVITKTLSTKGKSDFKIQLDYGKLYHIYFQHPKSPVMHMDVMANTVPPEKYDYLMGYELNIPMVHKNDEDIDTTVFTDPFHKVIFNGTKKMVDDTTYNNAFARNVIKKPAKEVKEVREVAQPPKDSIKREVKPATEAPVILAGRVLMNGNPALPVKNKSILIFDKNGKLLRSTYTNRFGAFCFPSIMASDAGLIKMEEVEPGSLLMLATTKNATVSSSAPANGSAEWNLKPEERNKLVDNNYTTNIGGKLVSSSMKEKKFFSKKDVYLCNKFNTIIKKTKTNLIGTFVFEDIKPDNTYYIGVDKTEITPGEKIDLLSKEDNYIATLDSLKTDKQCLKLSTAYNKVFNDLSIDEDEMKMDVNATIFGDNVNNPIGKLKIILLNDNYEVIDSAITDNFGTFKFKYLPFLKRFYLSAENTDNILDVFKNILIYSSDDNLIKIMTHQKGSKFQYKPVNAEMSRLRDIELEDPWLELIDDRGSKPAEKTVNGTPPPAKSIVENILFETGKYDITPQAKEILDKIILVLNTNTKLKIEVGAHTDSKGSDLSNMKLSQLRAITVQRYISGAGIDPKRIISKGYGESKLLNNCKDNVPCNELEHAQNRRIEFKILGE
jgi:outer membrane protein OmpA-like peptidoglycan-associated protein